MCHSAGLWALTGCFLAVSRCYTSSIRSFRMPVVLRRWASMCPSQFPCHSSPSQAGGAPSTATCTCMARPAFSSSPRCRALPHQTDCSQRTCFGEWLGRATSHKVSSGLVIGCLPCECVHECVPSPNWLEACSCCGCPQLPANSCSVHRSACCEPVHRLMQLTECLHATAQDRDDELEGR